jgi:hypothetical protein
MRETAIVATVALAVAVAMLTLAITVSDFAQPRTIVEPSPVAGCRIAHGQSWAPKDSVFRAYVCPDPSLALNDLFG